MKEGILVGCNPKFSRSACEKDLAFRFSLKYCSTIAKLEAEIYSTVSAIGKVRKNTSPEQISDIISQCKNAIKVYEKAKEFCYSKGKGGELYFDDMWEHCHNSKVRCFSYIQSTIDLLDVLENRIATPRAVQQPVNCPSIE